MSTKKSDYYDGYDGLADEMRKSKFVESQCKGCESNVGFDECKEFGKKPYDYASVIRNVNCPKRKEKKNAK